jgi:hypothetical protein
VLTEGFRDLSQFPKQICQDSTLIGCCEHGNEPSDSIELLGFLE